MEKRKTIKVKLEKRGNAMYVVKQLVNEIVLDAREWSLEKDIRLGDALTEQQAITLNSRSRLEVTVV